MSQYQPHHSSRTSQDFQKKPSAPLQDEQSLSVRAIQTRLFKRGESLTEFVVQHTPNSWIREGIIIAVTSKIVSLAEERLVAKSSIAKKDLIEKEADHNFGEIGYGCYLTIKHGLFIASAGIDESNSENEEYILYPEDPFWSAKKLGLELRERWKIKNLGIIMTDSHTTPLRRGVTGISLAHWGFHAVRNMIGKEDLFGRKLQMTTINVADGLAAAATLMMGEANECRPLALLECGDIEFSERDDGLDVRIPAKDDLYLPFFKDIEIASPD